MKTEQQMTLEHARTALQRVETEILRTSPTVEACEEWLYQLDGAKLLIEKVIRSLRDTNTDVRSFSMAAGESL